MSGECEKCGEHCLDCRCESVLSERNKNALLKALNERFTFTKQGEMIPKDEDAYEPIILSDYYEI